MRIVFLNPVGVLGGGERGLLTAMAEVRRAAPTADLTLLTAADGPLLDRRGASGSRRKCCRSMPSWPASATAGRAAHGSG